MRPSWIILVGHIFCSMGMFLVWLSTMITQKWSTILVCACVLMTMGISFIRSSALSFSIDQETVEPNMKAHCMYYLLTSLVIFIWLVGFIIIQNIVGWKYAFGFSTIFMVGISICFLFTLKFYNNVNPQRRIFFSLICVVVAAFRKQDMQLTNETVYHFGLNKMQTPPTEFLRCLNKACAIRNPQNVNEERLCLEEGLCSVEVVQELKSLLGVIPIWSSSILISMAISPDAFQIFQSNAMDNKVNVHLSSEIFVFFILGGTIIGLSIIMCGGGGVIGNPKTIMAIGLCFSCISMICFSVVETFRKISVHLSIWFLLPQYISMGLSYEFFTVGSNYFYNNETSPNLATLTSSCSGLGGAIGGIFSIGFQQISWIRKWRTEQINEGKYEYYYLFMTGICVFNFFWLNYWSRRYGNLLAGWAYGEAQAPEAQAPDAPQPSEAPPPAPQQAPPPQPSEAPPQPTFLNLHALQPPAEAPPPAPPQPAFLNPDALQSPVEAPPPQPSETPPQPAFLNLDALQPPAEAPPPAPPQPAFLNLDASQPPVEAPPPQP